MSLLTVRRGEEAWTLEFEGGLLLADGLRRCGCFLPMPCGGGHTCGKCAVKAWGLLSPLGVEERAYLPAGSGLRLACCATALGDCRVELPSLAQAEVVGPQPPLGQRGPAGTGLGLAADIGTTTLAVSLYDLPTGACLGGAGALNRQGGWGGDVIARIGAAQAGALGDLQACVTSQLSALFSDLLSQAGRSPSEVTRVVVTGNTVMLHLLTGLDPSGMGSAPFTPASLFGQVLDAGALFPGLSARLYLPRCMGPFVGGDVTCAALASGLTDGDGPALLVDAGTNGEMALWSGGRLFSCSVAAGPAFEGTGLSMGMTASAGAVARVLPEGPVGVRWETVGSAPPAGICGTGVVSCLNLMLAQGVLDETGRIQPGGHPLANLVRAGADGPLFLLGDSGVSVTQGDVRQVQLAKAAVATGVESLLHAAGHTPDQVERLVLCGGFGSRMDPAEAAGIGLIPPTLAGRTQSGGNAALTGAVRLLMDPILEKKAQSLADLAQELDLSASAWFMERYVENMLFPA